MKVNIHEITEYFAKANVTFADAFIEKRKPDDSSRKINRRTNPLYGGLVIPITGRAYLSLNGSSYEIQPGVIVHAGPGMRLNIDVPDVGHWGMAVLHYKLPKTEEELFPLFHTHYSMHIKESARILDLYQQLYQIQTVPGAAAKLCGKRLFMEFLGELFDASEKYLADGKTELMDHVMNYIRQNYANGLNINQIADHFKIDRRKLALLFKQHTGMTPSSYLMECRILKAKELLHSCDCPIKLVAECAGYTDSLFFSRAFKKSTGLSPTEYRNSTQNTW